MTDDTIDVERLIDEIDDEVRRRRADGGLDPEFERDLDAAVRDRCAARRRRLRRDCSTQPSARRTSTRRRRPRRNDPAARSSSGRSVAR